MQRTLQFAKSGNRLRQAIKGGMAEATSAVAATASSGGGEVAAESEKRRGGRKKWALLLSYSGKGYNGMQIQSRTTGVRTIEEELLKALRLEGFIDEEAELNPSGRFYFQRAARTDKGVSAVRQVVSFMLKINDLEARETPDKLNAHLPHQIRAMEMRRATKSFDSKNSCDSRTYSYTLPTFAFAHVDELTNEQFRITPERLAEVSAVLRRFVGTHNFFNYTSRREHGMASCNRFIRSFAPGEPFLVSHEGSQLEMLTCSVHGQSFMLHQIRKMMGMCVAIIRGFKTLADIDASWKSERMDIPRVPGLGLLLEKVHYEAYDKKFGASHVHINSWDCEEKIERFKQDIILPDIFQTEIKERSMLNWLGSLHLHNFDLPEALEPTLKEEEKKVEEEEKVKEEETGEEQDEPEAKKRRSSSLSQLHRDLQEAGKTEATGGTPEASDH